MKKILIILLVVIMLLLQGCLAESSKDNKLNLEEDGYVYVRVITGHNLLGSEGAVGYITEDELNNYLNGTLDGIVKVLHPYEENKFVVVKAKDIEKLVVD